MTVNDDIFTALYFRNFVEEQLILEEYTFLKRPVILVNGTIFIGNAQKNVDALIKFLN